MAGSTSFPGWLPCPLLLGRLGIVRMRTVLAMAVSVMLLAAACGDSDDLKADAGSDFSISVGDAPTFDGCASGGEIQNYRWVIVAAPDIMEGDAGKVIREVEPNCSFTLEASMEVQEVGTWVVELTVTDDSGASSVDTVEVAVTE